MLGKLIKYDLKSISKTLVPLWLTVIALSLILGGESMLSVHFFKTRQISTDSIAVSPNALGYFTLFILVLLFMIFLAIIVFNIIFIVQRFWNGLLKEEGYLMFTLPVTPRYLIFSKAISALLVSLGSILVSIISVLIMGFGFFHSAALENGYNIKESFAELFRIIGDTLSGMDVGYMLFLIIYLCVFFLVGLYEIYAAMAIGQLSNKSRLLCSFAAYVGINILLSFLTPFILIREDSSRMPISSEALQLIVFVLETVVLHIITEVLLTRKLNLE